MGIDQSYRSTGLVVIDENEKILHSEIIPSNKEDEVYFSAWLITNNIIQTVNQFKPDNIAIEGLSYGLRGNATRDLAGLQFMIISRIKYENSYKNIIIVAPLTLKKFATGSGSAKTKKIDIIKSLPEYALTHFLEYGVKKTTGLGDLADAFFLSKIAKEKYQ